MANKYGSLTKRLEKLIRDKQNKTEAPKIFILSQLPIDHEKKKGLGIILFQTGQEL